VNHANFPRHLGKKLRLSAFFIAFSLLSGCAHQNLIDAGQQLMTHQQYELAVEKFSAALEEEPNDKATLTQLSQAQNSLTQWANNLETQAAIAKQNQQPEKALLLYAKAFEITRSPQANQQYKALYQQLREQSMINVRLDINSTSVSEQVIDAIDGLQLTSDQSATEIKFSQSNPIFEIEQSQLTVQTQYVSGSQIVANPQLLEMQHSLSHNQREQRENRRDIKSARRNASSLHNTQQQLSSKLSHIEMALTASSLTQAKRSQLNSSLSSVQSSLTRVENQLQHAQSTLSSLRGQYSHLVQDTNNLAHELAHTPATMTVPVYSDYQYPVNQQVNSLTSTLYLSVFGHIRPADITVDSKDQSHPAHPTINLAANSMQVASKAALTPLLIEQRNNVARRLLVELVDERKLGFFYQSKQTLNADEKLALLIKHGLITQQGAIEEVSEKIQQLLIMEYGLGGEFNVNQLLHLYR